MPCPPLRRVNIGKQHPAAHKAPIVLSSEGEETGCFSETDRAALRLTEATSTP
ncbi:hypothetical protein ACH4GP_18165 [Streptomyces celluloflavus]|uniref:Uncharacterized protein n=1 Tax=Streptomyces celluloflavus TaxID=58344 RepID=A0ABW7RFZ5_9ACTN